MATATIVLSSSPSRSPIAVTPTHRNVVAMSSSPGLPSPSQLFAAMPSQLSGGSRAAPIPKDAVAGFASASTLLRLARFERDDRSSEGLKGLTSDELQNARKPEKMTARQDKEKPRPTQDKAPAFKVPKPLLCESDSSIDSQTICAGIEQPMKSESTSKAPVQKRPRKRKSKDGVGRIKTAKDEPLQSVIAIGSEQLLDEVRPRKTPVLKKSRKKNVKDEKEGQTKIKKAKIVKPGSLKTTEKETKEKALPIETFNTLLGTQEENARAREEFRGLCSEKAIPIRRGWTPCEDTVTDHACSVGITQPSESTALEHTPAAIVPSAARFGDLLGDFAHIQNVNSQVVKLDISHRQSGELASKKRKIELVNGSCVPQPAEKQKRTKSPKKKPQTITEKATAPFGPIDPLTEPSLLQYFSPSGGSAEEPAKGNDSAATASMKAPAKRASKTKIVKSTAKRSTLPILLSPESAIKDARDQELVFGTSSQLVREESPTFIKNIQQAMEESANLSQVSDISLMPAGKFRTSNPLAVVRPQSLWAVASRDFDGSLLEAETVDLTETPKPSKTKSDLSTCPKPADTVGYQAPQESQHRMGAIDISLSAQLNLNPTPILQQHIDESHLPIIKTVAEATLRKRPSNRCPVKNATNSKSDPNQMPNYQGFTDAQLAKEVSAYGFKSIKKRDAMIALLERCWEAKISMALPKVQANLEACQSASVSANVEAIASSSPSKKNGRPPKNAIASSAVADDPAPKRPRGRPKKDPTTATPPPKRKRKAKSPVKAKSEALVTAEDDIYDSSPPTPSPPRRSSPKTSKQLHLSQSAKPCVEAETVKAKEEREQIFAQMTKAITTFPPTNDIKNLTFHEKILMYEPVVLEDLAAWLNTQGLASVGEDDEVEPALVKEWCEERSVCCLWRENLRGGARGRW